MELITAQMLWKDYDLRGLPIGETVLSVEHKERYTIKYIYFNGEATADGCTRVYAHLYIPSSIPSGASVVLMNDVSEPFDTTYVDMLCDYGFTVLVPDYAGKRPLGRYTIYPESLSYGNFFEENGGFKLPTTAQEARYSSWYTYAIIMARGLYYLEGVEGLDKNKIAFMGVRRGALQAYKAAYLAPEACAVVTLFNSSAVDGIDVTSPEAMLYNTCTSPACYAAMLKVPTYIVEGSNNSENSLFATNMLYSGASEFCRFYIAENADNLLMPYQSRSIMAFLNAAAFARGQLPDQPTLEAKNSDRSLYYEIRVDRPEEAATVKLNYSYCNETGAYRSWSRLALQRVSESEYIAKAAVYNAKQETSAFTSVIYKSGLILSGEIITKVPALMGVSSDSVVRSRLIYDVDMGTDCWMIRSKRGFGEITVEETESGICGVTSSVNSLTTLKIGDVNTCGERDGALQLLVYSGREQSITVEVTCRLGEGGYANYLCVKRPSAFGEWTKITLSVEDFRSERGVMRGWDEAVGVTITGEDKLLINSLLWI